MIFLGNLKGKNYFIQYLGLRLRDCKVKMNHIKNMTKLLVIQKSSEINNHLEKQHHYRVILELLQDLAAMFNQMQPTYKIFNCK